MLEFTMVTKVIVVGAGIFGVTAAVELRARGYDVRLFDPGPVPHPLAASTDISKVIRLEYGADEEYMELMEDARDGWLEWNRHWRSRGRPELYHETGMIMACREPMVAGGYEYESWKLLRKRGHQPERLNPTIMRERFPGWSDDRYVDGFLHAKGGYAESGRVVTALLDEAIEQGVAFVNARVTALSEAGGHMRGVIDDKDDKHNCDAVVLANGAWVSELVPELDECIRPTGHPVFHLAPEKPADYSRERFPTFTADVSRTGYYGFPANEDGVVKIANHGVGTRLKASDAREVSEREEKDLRAFLRDTFPGLAGANIVYRRLCLYADTQDEHFWIAPHPGKNGLVVAGGGSGHGFKFAPILGRLIADAVEGKDNSRLKRFRWRQELRKSHGEEAARYHGEDHHAID